MTVASATKMTPNPNPLGRFVNGQAVCECGFAYPMGPQVNWTAKEAQAVADHQRYHALAKKQS
jgi:hypothetical protein